MPRIKRSSDEIEIHSEMAFIYGMIAISLGGFGGFVFAMRGSSAQLLTPVCIVLMTIGVVTLGAAIYRLIQIRKVGRNAADCPYCKKQNEFVEAPENDWVCAHCNRVVPVENGTILRVDQVRCGYCNTLNYYSDKTEVLICEECSHEIPIALPEHHVSTKAIPRGYAVVEDVNYYELALLDAGNKTEEIITVLQNMLTLNRSHVKQILNELPATLLTGINHRKAEMLVAQLAAHGALAEYRLMPLSESEPASRF